MGAWISPQGGWREEGQHAQTARSKEHNQDHWAEGLSSERSNTLFTNCPADPLSLARLSEMTQTLNFENGLQKPHIQN